MDRITRITDTIMRVVRRAADEAGEGVISTAIAVLVLAFVGAGMWIGFSSIMEGTCAETAGIIDETVTGGSGSIDCE